MKDNTMPSLESIKEGRSNQVVYTKYCDLFLLDVVHRNKWNWVVATERQTCIATFDMDDQSDNGDDDE